MVDSRKRKIACHNLDLCSKWMATLLRFVLKNELVRYFRKVFSNADLTNVSAAWVTFFPKSYPLVYLDATQKR